MGSPLPPATHLLVTPAEAGLVLTWTVPETREPVGGTQVFRARRDPGCGGCPLTYEKVGNVPYTDVTDRKFRFVDNPEQGHIYRYMVRLEPLTGELGRKSETVEAKW